MRFIAKPLSYKSEAQGQEIFSRKGKEKGASSIRANQQEIL
jgi:hypothetical protein